MLKTLHVLLPTHHTITHTAILSARCARSVHTMSPEHGRRASQFTAPSPSPSPVPAVGGSFGRRRPRRTARPPTAVQHPGSCAALLRLGRACRGAGRDAIEIHNIMGKEQRDRQADRETARKIDMDWRER